MRSSLFLLSPLAAMALLGLGFAGPVAEARSVPDMMSICTGAGMRVIERPGPQPGRNGVPCLKPCHGLCQRKRGDGTQTAPDDQ